MAHKDTSESPDGIESNTIEMFSFPFESHPSCYSLPFLLQICGCLILRGQLRWSITLIKLLFPVSQREQMEKTKCLLIPPLGSNAIEIETPSGSSVLLNTTISSLEDSNTKAILEALRNDELQGNAMRANNEFR